MQRDRKRRRGEEEIRGFEVDTIEQVMRERVQATIEVIVEEELEAAPGTTGAVRRRNNGVAEPGTAPGINGARRGSMRRSWGCISVGPTAGDYKVRWLRCCGAGRYRRMWCRG